jgi:hypothetical protein
MVQSLAALSTTELEYMVVVVADKKVLWLTSLVKKLGIQQSLVRVLFTWQRTKCIIQKLST